MDVGDVIKERCNVMDQVAWRCLRRGLTIFYIVFMNLCYPVMWCYNKLFVLYKSGEILDVGIYRCISIVDTLAKMCDLLI